MKTSEFIKRLDECGDEILNIDNIFSDLGDELYLTSIKTNQFNITFYYDEEPNEIIDIIAEYLKTPVKEREEEKKYYLRQKGMEDYNAFLNYERFDDRYFTDNKKEHGQYITQFTQSEIDNMPECYTHPSVWEQVRVEEQDNV